MKNTLFSIIFLTFVAFATTSCITSKFTAGEAKDQVEDNNIVGTWNYDAPKTAKKADEGDITPKTLTFTAGENPKSYVLSVLMPGDESGKGDSFSVVIHTINGENFMSFFAKKDNKKKEYQYAKYKIEGGKLMLYPVLEAKAVKNKKSFDMEKDKGTVFADKKVLRDLLAKNTKGANPNINTKEPVTYTK